MVRLEILNPNELQKIVDDIPHEKICNANQTCLCCQKLPDTLHVDAKNKKDHKEAKQMKDKTGVTPMVCASADGGKASLAKIGSQSALSFWWRGVIVIASC